jgi:hypothetical protein
MDMILIPQDKGLARDLVIGAWRKDLQKKGADQFFDPLPLPIMANNRCHEYIYFLIRKFFFGYPNFPAKHFTHYSIKMRWI